MMLIASILIVVLYSMQKNNLVSFGIYNEQVLTTMFMIAVTILGIPVFYCVCLPLSKYRRTSIVVIGLISIIMLVTSAIISYTSNKVDPIFGIPFMEMSGPAYFVTGIIVTVLIALYFVINKIFGKGEEYEN